jgi:undecaprenyl diphosphate synthase
LIYWLYERRLLRELTTIPGTVCFMLSGTEVAAAPEKIFECTTWCLEISDAVQTRALHGGARGIDAITYHISTPSIGFVAPIIPILRRIATIAHLVLHCGAQEEVAGEGITVTIAIGKSGREEIANAIRTMAEEAIPPDEVTEATLESHLTFRYAPDLVIKTGGDNLTDFLIWQSVYSELFFSEVNWALMRKIDLLRAFRDYQTRMRRFGK